MKNKILHILLYILLSNFIYFNGYATDQFNFDVTEVEILNNGNIIKGLKKGTVKTNDGITIIADTFIYDKLSNILNSYCPKSSFIPEIWQGHKNGGEGFWIALDRLDNSI